MMMNTHMIMRPLEKLAEIIYKNISCKLRENQYDSDEVMYRDRQIKDFVGVYRYVSFHGDYDLRLALCLASKTISRNYLTYYDLKSNYFKFITLILEEPLLEQLNLVKEHKQLYWFDDLIEVLSWSDPFDSRQEQPITQTDIEWIKNLFVNFFLQNPTGVNGLQLAFRVMLRALDIPSDKLKLLIVTYFADYNAKSLFQVSKHFPYKNLYKFLIAMLEEIDVKKVEKFALDCWNLCFKHAGKKGPETFELAKVMYDFYMHAEIDERKTRKFELFVLDFNEF